MSPRPQSESPPNVLATVFLEESACGFSPAPGTYTGVPGDLRKVSSSTEASPVVRGREALTGCNSFHRRQRPSPGW